MNRYDQRVQELRGEPSIGRLKDGTGVALEGELSDLENALGYVLPTDYREFLRDYGGYAFYYANCPVTMSYFAPPDTVTTTKFYSLYEFFTVMPQRSQYDVLTIYKSNLAQGVIPPNFLPIVYADAGYQYCIVLDGEEQGAVYFGWFNSVLELSGYDLSHIAFVAPSFDEFIGKWILDDEEEE